MVKSVLLDHLKFKKEVEALKLNHLSQEQIAERLGISDRHVRNLQTKSRPISAYLLYQMSIVFHRPMEYFLIILEED